jgi:hypothetical protein
MRDGRESWAATAVAKVIAWLGVAVVIVCVYFAVHGTEGPGLRFDLVGGVLFVGMPAIPLVLIARGRPHRPLIAVISTFLIVSAEVQVVLIFLRDTHSTAGLRFFYSMGAAWLVWGLAIWVDGISDSRRPPVPPRPDSLA